MLLKDACIHRRKLDPFFNQVAQSTRQLELITVPES